MRGSLERDISSLRAFGPGGGQISRVVRVSARAPFGVCLQRSMVSCKRGTHLSEKCGFVQEGHTFLGKVWLRAGGAHIS